MIKLCNSHAFGGISDRSRVISVNYEKSCLYFYSLIKTSISPIREKL